MTDYVFKPEEIRAATGITTYLNQQSQSTQLDARQGMTQGNPSPALYLAPSQSQAAGRFGRSFHASKGGIYMTLHLKPNCTHDQLPVYTMMVATSLVKAIEWLTGKDCQIKWINDIYYQGKKIAGILTESLATSDNLVTDLLIGVGLNLYLTDFPQDLAKIAGSLFEKEPNLDPNQLISTIWQIFYQTPERDLIRVYRDKSLLIDKKVSFEENGQTYQATVTDISKKGELIILLPDGQERTLSSQISLSSWSR